jgi:flagellar basal-body rod protein FlgG
MALDYQPLFVLASGMLLQERKLSVVANNLANSSTTAFKRDLIESYSWYADMGDKLPDRSPENPTNNFVYPMVGRVFTDMSGGDLHETGNPLDVAIEGDGFFAVRVGEDILYTRKGNFRLNSDGVLVNEEGYPVLDGNENTISVFGDRIDIDHEGNIYADGELVGQLGVFRLENYRKVGKDLYSGQGEPAQGYRVLQGFLENSNVNPILEMARLIELSRAHEVYSRLIRAVDEIQSRVSNNITG